MANTRSMLLFCIVHYNTKKEETHENLSKHQIISDWNVWHGKAAEFSWNIFSINLDLFLSGTAKSRVL